MRLAFVLFKYFPYGGLQKLFLQSLLTCTSRGHDISVYTIEWQGETPANLNINIVPVKSKRNHQRYREFHRKLKTILKAEQFHAVVGFNKMPDLDVYFAADPCYLEKSKRLRGRYYCWTARFRHFADFERAVFQTESNCELLMMSEIEMNHFRHHYSTPKERFHILPPGISRHCMRPNDAQQVRQHLRKELGVSDSCKLLLGIGSDFHRKGIDRSIRALAALPAEQKTRTKLLVVGQDNPAKYSRLARRYGVQQQVEFLSGRSDIPRFLFGSDLLLHPARSEAAGMVILEAIVAGLPVLVTDVCGYASHVIRANAGRLIPAPFSHRQFSESLSDTLISPLLCAWQQNGVIYGRDEDLYSMHKVVCDVIEQKVRGLLN